MEIKGFSNYTIDYNGNVYSKFKNRFLKPQKGPRGWVLITLQNDKGQKRTKSIHRLLGETYLPNFLGKTQIDHKDGVKDNNSLFNLRWVTPSENAINRPLFKNNKTGFRHIEMFDDHKWIYYKINFKRNNKKIFCKTFSIKKYTLEEVVKIRNEKYKEFNIEIRD